MIKEDSYEKIKSGIREFFNNTGFEIEINILKPEENTIPVEIKTEEPKVLIGQNGQTLTDIQHLLKGIAKKYTDERLYINLDINNYKKKKVEYLKETARSSADDVALTGREKALPPMPAFERRVIHTVLTDRQDIQTESIGEEPNRRVIIRITP